MPRLQKLIEQYKNRSDVQFLSFNLDNNPGLIQPFLNEHQLSLTVIPAYSYVCETLKILGIPTNWIADTNGNVRLKGTGYDSTEKWVTGMKDAIEKVKIATAATSPTGASQ